jgi:hypothetical protein
MSTYIIHTDSISSSKWVQGSQNYYNSYLFRPIQDISQVDIVSLSVDVSQATTNVVYLYVDQFVSTYNQLTGLNDRTSDPVTTSKLAGSLARINVPSGTTRLLYPNNNDFQLVTEFRTPIHSIDRITTQLYDENGVRLVTNSNVFVTYRLKTISCVSLNEKIIS